MKKMPCFLPALLFLYLQPWAQARTQMPMQTPHQSQPYQPVVDRIIRQQVVDSLAHSLLTNYIFRDTAARMGTYIRQRLKEGAYDKITDPNEFAQMLTADLHSVYKDLHMSIFYDPQFEKMLRDTSTSDQAAA